MAAETRKDVLTAARRLFAERGYAATSIAEIAQEAGVAVQTIYSRLGSKSGIVLALVDLIDDESGLPASLAALRDADTPRDLVRAGIRVARGFPEKCGDIIDALTAAATAEPDAAAAIAEGGRRHRDGSRRIVDRIAKAGGLRKGIGRERAAALLAATTTRQTWYELVHEQRLSWDQAEELLVDGLGRALLA